MGDKYWAYLESLPCFYQAAIGDDTWSFYDARAIRYQQLLKRLSPADQKLLEESKSRFKKIMSAAGTFSVETGHYGTIQHDLKESSFMQMMDEYTDAARYLIDHDSSRLHDPTKDDAEKQVTNLMQHLADCIAVNPELAETRNTASEAKSKYDEIIKMIEGYEAGLPSNPVLRNHLLYCLASAVILQNDLFDVP